MFVQFKTIRDGLILGLCLWVCGCHYSLDAAPTVRSDETNSPEPSEDDAGGSSPDTGDSQPDEGVEVQPLYETTSEFSPGYTHSQDVDFGRAMAASANGLMLVLGAPADSSRLAGPYSESGMNDTSLANSGAAFVYTRMSGTWAVDGYIKPSTPQLEGQFGWSAALSDDGRTLAVGSPGERGWGTVYVYYRRDNGVWSERAYLKGSDTQYSDKFGYSLALSSDGRRLAVGAPYADSLRQGSDFEARDSGTVYIFSLESSDWVQTGYIKGARPTVNDHFGASLSFGENGSLLAVGATGHDNPQAGVGVPDTGDGSPGSGAVYIYRYNDSSEEWSTGLLIKASSNERQYFGDVTVLNDRFGQAIDLSEDGSVLVVGAPYDDSSALGIMPSDADEQFNAGAIDSGAAYVYTWSADASQWVHSAIFKPSSFTGPSQFGYSVTVSDDGQVIAVGAREEAGTASGEGYVEALRGSGAVYLYESAAEGWEQTTYMKDESPTRDGQFASQLAFTELGDVLMITSEDPQKVYCTERYNEQP